MDENMDFAGDGAGLWDEEESGAFVEFGRAMVPGREELERTLLGLVPAGCEETFVCVEIGTGTGWLSEAMLREFPRVRILGLDGSSQMLHRAGERLARYGARAELRPFRLEDHSWTEALPPVRVFLSSLVLHHLDGSGKRELFTRLLSRLEPGGALLFADLMQPRTESARRHYSKAWEKEILHRSLEIHGDARARDFFRRERWNIYEYPRTHGSTLDASRATKLDGRNRVRRSRCFLGKSRTRTAGRLQAR